jgi:hypothetical protein
MKRGEVQSSVIIYILTVFIAGTILLYGYTVVRGLVQTQEQVQLLDFEKSLTDEVKSLSFSFRDVKEEKFTVPSKYDLVCFANLDFSGTASLVPQNYLLVKDSISDNVKRNVFMLSNGKMKYGFYVGTIGVSVAGVSDFGCVNATNGMLKLRLEALGRKVSVSDW